MQNDILLILGLGRATRLVLKKKDNCFYTNCFTPLYIYPMKQVFFILFFKIRKVVNISFTLVQVQDN